MVQGQIEGHAQATVTSFSKIEEAQPGHLAFLANPKYEDYLYTTQASVILVNESLVLKQPVAATLVRVPNAYSAFAQLLSAYQQLQQQALLGIEQPSFIHPTATVEEGVYIGAFAYVGPHAHIGKGAKLYPQVYVGAGAQVQAGAILYAGVKLYHQCVVGAGAIIHAGTVIGSDGFGFAPQADGSYQKVPQIGNVVIEAGVEVGANTTIDRATMGSTLVRQGAKIDNLVQIAHNVEVGAHSVVAAQAGISGSTKLGQRVMIGGQAGLVGHITIGDGAKINAQSGVSKSLEAGQAVTGSPAHDYKATLRAQAVARRLPELEARLIALEKQLEALQQAQA